MAVLFSIKVHGTISDGCRVQVTATESVAHAALVGITSRDFNLLLGRWASWLIGAIDRGDFAADLVPTPDDGGQ